MSRPAVTIVGLIALLGACGAPAVSDVAPAPADPEAQMRPDLMLAPQAVRPGEIIGLRFPQATLRGVHFVLERRDGDAWQREYDLVSTANGGQPTWFRPGDEGVAIPDVGITGPGPDRVIIPEVAEPGGIGSAPATPATTSARRSRPSRRRAHVSPGG